MSNSNQGSLLHTPGPWASHKEYVLDQYANKVAVACPGSPLSQGDPLTNARLIAAAPELLAALWQIERLAREANRELVDVPEMLADIARAAIAKAKS